jgi:hypothetical protein
LYNLPKDIDENEKDILNSYIESRKGRGLLWVWSRELQARLKSLLMLRVMKLKQTQM